MFHTFITKQKFNRQDKYRNNRTTHKLAGHYTHLVVPGTATDGPRITHAVVHSCDDERPQWTTMSVLDA